MPARGAPRVNRAANHQHKIKPLNKSSRSSSSSNVNKKSAKTKKPPKGPADKKITIPCSPSIGQQNQLCVGDNSPPSPREEPCIPTGPSIVSPDPDITDISTDPPSKHNFSHSRSRGLSPSTASLKEASSQDSISTSPSTQGELVKLDWTEVEWRIRDNSIGFPISFEVFQTLLTDQTNDTSESTQHTKGLSRMLRFLHKYLPSQLKERAIEFSSIIQERFNSQFQQKITTQSAPNT